MKPRPSIIEAIDAHAAIAQKYRIELRRQPWRAILREMFVNHSCIAATLAVDQGIACDVPIGWWIAKSSAPEAA